MAEICLRLLRSRLEGKYGGRVVSQTSESCCAHGRGALAEFESLRLSAVWLGLDGTLRIGRLTDIPSYSQVDL